MTALAIVFYLFGLVAFAESDADEDWDWKYRIALVLWPVTVGALIVVDLALAVVSRKRPKWLRF